MTIQTEHPATGLARVDLGVPRRRLTYCCDPNGHRVTVADEFERVVFAFGRRGRGPGQFRTPMDVVFVRPETVGECLPPVGPDAVWLAVADYGNRRVQVFELDGAFVGEVKVEDEGRFGPPCGLEWRPPYLHIEGVEGARAQVHLAAALLAAGGLVHTASRGVREWLPLRERVN